LLSALVAFGILLKERHNLHLSPIYCGDMGRLGLVKKFSYGRYNWYDSLAPEFETYDAIKELAQKKKVKPAPVFSNG